MDSESEYVESDEDVRQGQNSEDERDDEGDQVEDDEIDPRNLMTSPLPESSSHRQRHNQHQHQNSLQPDSAQDQFTSSPTRDIKPQYADDIVSSNESTTLIPHNFPANIYTQGPNPTSYYTRPNRFFGPAATWKAWTRTERDLTVSLDRTRAADLSLHLCGAFALRLECNLVASLGGNGRRGRPPKRNAKWKGKGKARAVGIDGEGNLDESRDDDLEDKDKDQSLEHQTATYSLPRIWTSWPMPVQQIPRDELLPRLGGDDYGESYRARPDLRPSAALEDCLIAAATRLARERWEGRRWSESEKVDDGSPEQEALGREMVDIQGRSNDEDDNEDQDNGSAQEQVEHQIEDENNEEEPDYQIFTSQPYFSPPPSSSPPLRHSASPSETDASSHIKREGDISPSTSPSPSPSISSSSDQSHRPVPLADDEQARALFLPSARHILSKLDDLLLALHKSRAAYAGKPVGKPRGRTLSRSQSVSANVSRTRELERGRRKSRGRESSGHRRDASSRNNDADVDGEDDEAEDSTYHDSESPANSPTRAQHHDSSAEPDLSMPSTPPLNTLPQQTGQKRKRTRTLGVEKPKLQLRDWSDVVGMAALAGWDPAVVERASERCARLFGENMLFRTFAEGDDVQSARIEPGNQRETSMKNARRSWYTEQLALDDESSEDLAERVGEAGRVPARRVRLSARCGHCVAARSPCLPLVMDQDEQGDEDESQPETKTHDLSEAKDHSTFPTRRVTCRRCTEKQLECSGIVVQELKDDGDIDIDGYPPQWHERACPYKYCARHEIPFRKMYHLQRHLNSAHAGERTREQSKIRSRSRVRDMRFRRTLHDPDTDVVVDVDMDMDMDMDTEGEYYTTATSMHEHHVTIPSPHTILCPVYECKRRRVPFSRGAKLYSHVKRMHPDVDVKALKRMETARRGERRGRPRGQGSRSQSHDQGRNQSRVGNLGMVMRTTRSASRLSGEAGEVRVEISDDGDE